MKRETKKLGKVQDIAFDILFEALDLKKDHEPVTKEKRRKIIPSSGTKPGEKFQKRGREINFAEISP